jgi:hypothetical protein
MVRAVRAERGNDIIDEIGEIGEIIDPMGGRLVAVRSRY